MTVKMSQHAEARMNQRGIRKDFPAALLAGAEIEVAVGEQATLYGVNRGLSVGRMHQGILLFLPPVPPLEVCGAEVHSFTEAPESGEEGAVRLRATPGWGEGGKWGLAPRDVKVRCRGEEDLCVLFGCCSDDSVATSLMDFPRRKRCSRQL